MLGGHEINRCAIVIHLAPSLVPGTGAPAHATKIEPQHHASDSGESLGALEDHFRVHRATLRRKRVREHYAGSRRACWLVDERVQWTHRARNLADPSRQRRFKQRVSFRQRVAMTPE